MNITSIPELIRQAPSSVSEDVWDHIAGAAGTEMTMRRNRRGLDSLALRPRVLRDVSNIELSTSFLGHKLRIPVMLAPIGSLHLIRPDATAEAARAAATFGTLSFVSSVAEPGFEAIASAAPVPKFFQLYIRGDSDDLGRTIDRVVASGYQGIAVTVDSAHYGIRDRVLLRKWHAPARSRPGREHQTKVTWKTIEEIKARASSIPVMLKGIQTAEDARLAVEHGAAAVYVSNHGGRQLDHCQATIDILPEVAEAVGGRLEIVIDGGFTRGTDVVKALALGATAVSIGRLYAYALACGGQNTVVQTLELLEGELRNVMGLMGLTSIREIDSKAVTAGRAA